jgi:hypothetical protein
MPSFRSFRTPAKKPPRNDKISRDFSTISHFFFLQLFEKKARPGDERKTRIPERDVDRKGGVHEQARQGSRMCARVELLVRPIS